MFTVRWKPSARDELTDLWVNADSALRRAITQASDRIDRRLAADPLNTGESRPNGRRIYFHSPLGVLFRVYPNRSLVWVLAVWKF